MRSTSPILLSLVIAAGCLWPTSARAESCVKCHVKPAEAITEKRELVFDRDRWNAGVKGNLAPGPHAHQIPGFQSCAS
jgi:hypothetical protein